jgi:hypothetical protein
MGFKLTAVQSLDPEAVMITHQKTAGALCMFLRVQKCHKQGYTNFPKIYESPPNYRYQNGTRSKHIAIIMLKILRASTTKFLSLGDLALPGHEYIEVPHVLN